MLSLLQSSGKIFLADGGRLPRSENCCCEELCTDCLSQCQYQIRVSGASLFVTSPAYECGTAFGGTSSAESDFSFGDTIPEDIGGTINDDLTKSEVNASFLFPGGPEILLANVSHSYSKYDLSLESTGCVPDVDFAGNLRLSVSAGISTVIRCQSGRPDSAFYASVALSITVVITDSVSSGACELPCTGAYAIALGHEEPLDVTCNSPAGMACVPQLDSLKRPVINTPITYTANSGSSGLGPWSITVVPESSCGTYGEMARDIGEAIKDSLSATFTIVSRPSCITSECSCSQGLSGIAISLLGERFVVGNEPNPSRGSGQQVWTFTDGTNPSITYEVFDEFFVFIKTRIVVELFCSSSQEHPSLPNPQSIPTWYMIAYADCFVWNSGILVATTRETSIGKYDCYEHCDKFLPHGAPWPVISVSVETPEEYGGGCTPPPQPSLIIDYEPC